MIYQYLCIALLACLIASLMIGGAWFNKARMYRQLWIEMGKKWEVARAERDEWIETARQATPAQMRREITKAHEKIDELTNGDLRCVLGHRFYSGNNCPHCGSGKLESFCR